MLTVHIDQIQIILLILTIHLQLSHNLLMQSQAQIEMCPPTIIQRSPSKCVRVK